MKTSSNTLKQKLILALFGSLTFTSAMATSEGYKVKKPIASHQEQQNDSKQQAESQKYHGVYYGVLPCNDCAGIMVTLSLKNRNNYLLVSQKAKNSAREYFEKGKYDWNEQTKIVTLSPFKKSQTRKYRINDDNTLTELSSKGVPLKATQKNTSYRLYQKEMDEKKALMHIR